ncbi:hypothetical protein C3L33_20789, partial [Rhododendron williamsianum]
MEKILGIVINKKERTMADAWIVEDLSSWELVDPSDDDNDEDYSYDELDLYVFESPPSSDLSAQSPPPHDLVDHANDREDRVDLAKRVSIDEKCLYTVTEVPPNVKSWLRFRVYKDYDDENDDGGDGDVEEEKFDDYGGEYDLDDELVPKNVIDRFGRQRIRKLGKRAFSKMNKAKKLPYAYNRPGCVYGKHGLGLKHSLIN